MITMLTDHIGAVWLPDAPVWRVIGRLAFPIYAYYVAVGMERTRNKRRYLIRLAWLAAMSQIPFSLLFHTWTVNVIGTFLVSAAATYRMESAKDPVIKGLWIVGAAGLMELIRFDYGAYGLTLLLLYRYAREEQLWLGHLGMNALYWLMGTTPVQLFSLLPTFLFAFKLPPESARNGSASYTVPRWLWRAWYPAHLALLAAATLIIAPLPAGS